MGPLSKIAGSGVGHMNKWQFAVAAMAMLTLSACHRHKGAVQPGPATNLVKGIYKLPSCSVVDSDIKGTVDIVLPNNLDGGKIDRAVYQGPKVAKGDPILGKGDPDWGDNNPRNGGSPSTPPFDTYVDMKNFSSGYLLMRMLLTHGAKFDFVQDFNGIAGNDSSGDILCGAELVPINGGAGQAQSAAVFYVDLAKLNNLGKGGKVHFTVGLIADGKGANAAPTPILIDPMITNDGGG